MAESSSANVGCYGAERAEPTSFVHQKVQVGFASLSPPNGLQDVTCKVIGRLVVASTSSAKPSRVKVREHRERLRAQGLRPIQIWVPDLRSNAFRSEANGQSAAVATIDPRCRNGPRKS
jgi:hypothetical protein